MRGGRERFLIRDGEGNCPDLFDAVPADASFGVLLTGIWVPRQVRGHDDGAGRPLVSRVGTEVRASTTLGRLRWGAPRLGEHPTVFVPSDSVAYEGRDAYDFEPR